MPSTLLERARSGDAVGGPAADGATYRLADAAPAIPMGVPAAGELHRLHSDMTRSVDSRTADDIAINPSNGISRTTSGCGWESASWISTPIAAW